MYKSNAVFEELDTSERVPSQRMHSEPGDGQGRYVRYGDSIRWNRFNPVSRSPGTFRPSPPRRLATSPFSNPLQRQCPVSWRTLLISPIQLSAPVDKASPSILTSVTPRYRQQRVPMMQPSK